MTEKTKEYTRLEQAHYQEIQEVERFIRRLEYKHETAKCRAKLAKEELETYQIELRNMIAAGPGYESKPGMEFDPLAASREQPAWHTWPIEMAVHEAGLVKALKTFGVATIGNLADHSNNGETLSSIPGIGEMGEAKIIEQLQMFWEENPGLADPLEIEPSGPDDPTDLE